mmetsp:Transcript_906/g.1357  ORF Transcript_906/g.1357 Transcript_906/m.1357 type:complete len:178 (+) Transcript_906:2-535(+)
MIVPSLKRYQWFLERSKFYSHFDQYSSFDMNLLPFGHRVDKSYFLYHYNLKEGKLGVLRHRVTSTETFELLLSKAFEIAKFCKLKCVEIWNPSSLIFSNNDHNNSINYKLKAFSNTIQNLGAEENEADESKWSICLENQSGLTIKNRKTSSLSSLWVCDKLKKMSVQWIGNEMYCWV